MKLFFYLLIITITLILACGNDDEKSNENTKNFDNAGLTPHYGEVIEKIDAANYSYLQIKEDSKTYWIAVSSMDINSGEQIFFSNYMEMKNFKSEPLGRTFESILFVNNARNSSSKSNLQNVHSNSRSLNKESINIEPVSDGNTIGQIYSERESLKNSIVKVNGKVVKFNSQIMNRNWIHIQDGTADNDGYDLIITSSDVVSVGDIIVAEGTLAVDKDFGAGYRYSVIIENAKLTKELL